MSSYNFLLLLGIIIAIVYIAFRPIRRSIRNKWQKFATEQGLYYWPHNINNDFALHGNYQNCEIQVFCRFPSRHQQARTIIKVRMSNLAQNLHFFISPGVSLFPNVSHDRVKSGDPELDKRFEFGGHPQQQVAKLLSSTRFSTLLKLADMVPNFDRLIIEDKLLELSGPFYLEEPTQFVEYLTRVLQCATVVEQELTAISDPSISTNPLE